MRAACTVSSPQCGSTSRRSDRKGRDYDPSEWFVVPLNVIDQAIDLIISGDIVGYVYDAQSQKLFPRD